MKGLFVHEVLKVTAGICCGNRDYLTAEIEAADTDSRNLVHGALFFAIKGSRVDSHIFIKELFENRKIVCAVGEKPFKEVFDVRENEIAGIYIQVKNVYAALLQVATLYRTKLSAKIIGITGSVGKTGTKEMIASVLSENFSVHKTQGNYNNEIGVPLTIFGIEPYHEIAVIEMGINGFGQMSTLAAVVRPDIMVMTNIGHCHLEQLKDRDGVLKAKSEVLDYLMPGACIVVNKDDDKLEALNEWTIADEKNRLQKLRVISFGLKNKSSDMIAKNIRLSDDGCASFDIQASSFSSFSVTLNLIGEHHIYNALSAVAVASVFKMKEERIARGLEKTLALTGRASLYHLSGHVRLIDDCYNANPDSMRASLSSLSAMKTDSRFAIIGDMLELGENSEEEHKKIAEFILNHTGIRKIWLVGTNMLEAYRVLQKEASVECRHFYEVSELNAELKSNVLDGELILIKASHSMGFEKIKENLMLDFSKR